MADKTIDYASCPILVIDDHPFVRRTLAALLGQIGFRFIAEADDGESGLHQCVETEPALIVCDIEMKPMSGLQFLAQLRSSPEVPNNRVPVIFLTVHAESATVRKAISLGVDSSVVKPPSFNTMKQRIDHLLGSR